MEINNLPNSAFQLTVITIFTSLERRVNELSENINRERKKNYSEQKHIITEMENTAEGINRRLLDDRERVSNLETG